MSQSETIQPTAKINPWIALIILPVMTISFSALYTVVSHNLEFVIVTLVLAVLFVLVSTILHSAIAAPLVVRVIFGVINGILAIATLWGVWFWLQADISAALNFLLSGPVKSFSTAYDMAQFYSYQLMPRPDVVINFGPTGIRILWLIETLAFGLSPILGALIRKKHVA